MDQAHEGVKALEKAFQDKSLPADLYKLKNSTFAGFYRRVLYSLRDKDLASKEDLDLFQQRILELEEDD